MTKLDLFYSRSPRRVLTAVGPLVGFSTAGLVALRTPMEFGSFALLILAYIGWLVVEDRRLRRQTELAPTMLRELRSANGPERLRIVLPGVIEIDRAHETAEPARAED